MGEVGTDSVKEPFLFDECLSPDLAALANARHHHATHVVFRGLQGTLDADLMPVIREGNFIFITNSGKDFLALYAEEEIHPGLVIIIPCSHSLQSCAGKAVGILVPRPRRHRANGGYSQQGRRSVLRWKCGDQRLAEPGMKPAICGGR